MQPNEVWASLDLPENLRQYMTLSSADVNNFTQLAMQAAHPKAKLEEMLIARAVEKKATAERHMEERMKEDKRRIVSIDQWPLPWLPVKSQPWISTVSGIQSHGRIEQEDLTTVLFDGAEPKIYNSLDELVAFWSVD